MNDTLVGGDRDSAGGDVLLLDVALVHLAVGADGALVPVVAAQVPLGADAGGLLAAERGDLDILGELQPTPSGPRGAEALLFPSAGSGRELIDPPCCPPLVVNCPADAKNQGSLLYSEEPYGREGNIPLPGLVDLWRMVVYFQGVIPGWKCAGSIKARLTEVERRTGYYQPCSDGMLTPDWLLRGVAVYGRRESPARGGLFVPGDVENLLILHEETYLD